MKGQFIFMLLCAALLLCACGPSEMEKETKRKLHEMVAERSAEGDKYEIRDLETVYVCDSLCVLTFTGGPLEGVDVEEEAEDIRYEFFYLTSSDADWQENGGYCVPIGDGSIYEAAVEEYEEIAKSLETGEWDEDDLIALAVKEAAEEGQLDKDKKEQLKGTVIYAAYYLMGSMYDLAQHFKDAFGDWDISDEDEDLDEDWGLDSVVTEDFAEVDTVGYW